MTITFLWIHIEFKYRSFAIRQKDILYKSGWLFQKTTAVPYTKIQHCSVVQGIVSRIYRLANINIYTAASNNFDVSIKGLKLEEAEQLKDWLMQQNNNNE
jgi:membrane protein YdbS with pleckstrin-like domain